MMMMRESWKAEDVLPHDAIWAHRHVYYIQAPRLSEPPHVRIAMV
jgi:hypothetical protein